MKLDLYKKCKKIANWRINYWLINNHLRLIAVWIQSSIAFTL